jgi:hypothetical protein
VVADATTRDMEKRDQSATESGRRRTQLLLSSGKSTVNRDLAGPNGPKAATQTKKEKKTSNPNGSKPVEDGLSQREMGAVVGVSHVTIGRDLNGTNVPKPTEQPKVESGASGTNVPKPAKQHEEEKNPSGPNGPKPVESPADSHARDLLKGRFEAIAGRSATNIPLGSHQTLPAAYAATPAGIVVGVARPSFVLSATKPYFLEPALLFLPRKAVP